MSQIVATRSDRWVGVQCTMLVAVILPLEWRDAIVVQFHDVQQFVAHARHQFWLWRRRIFAVVANNLVVRLPEQQKNVQCSDG